MLLDAAMLDWLTSALAAAPEPTDARLRLTAPAPAVVETLAQPLAERLADMHGLIAGAALAGAGDGHVVLIAGADPAHQPAIAKALAEALAFLPPQSGGVDVSFTDATLPAGILRFDLTPPEEPEPAPRPKGPPILR
jgi:hypothetical protein